MYLHRNKAALTAHAMLGNVERYNSERKSREEKERIIVRCGLRDPWLPAQSGGIYFYNK